MVEEASCSARLIAALPSLTITMRKCDVIASRHNDSQQTLLTLPAMPLAATPFRSNRRYASGMRRLGSSWVGRRVSTDPVSTSCVRVDCWLGRGMGRADPPLPDRHPLPRYDPIGASGFWLYQEPVFGMLVQGSAGGNAVPACSSSMEMPSGVRTNAIRPSRGGRFPPCQQD